MGTRGFYGFVINGDEKVGYTHWGGAPDGVGTDLLAWARSQTDWDDVKARATAVKVVDSDSTPTDEDIEKLAPWTNLGVGSQSTSDWYCLLREAQGDINGMLVTGYVLDNSQFPLDSLMCEGGALVDLDAMTFEYYDGCIKEPHTDGRYADRGGRDGYHPVRLVGSWPLDSLPTDEVFIAAVGPDDDE